MHREGLKGQYFLHGLVVIYLFIVIRMQFATKRESIDHQINPCLAESFVSIFGHLKLYML